MNHDQTAPLTAPKGAIDMGPIMFAIKATCNLSIQYDE